MKRSIALALVSVGGLMIYLALGPFRLTESRANPEKALVGEVARFDSTPLAASEGGGSRLEVERDDGASGNLDTSEPPLPRVPKREILAAYWGSRWPGIEQDLLERGADLDGLIAAPPPWEEVEEELHKFVLGNLDDIVSLYTAAGLPVVDDERLRSSKYNPEGKILGPHEIEAMRSLVTEFEQPLLDAIQALVREDLRLRRKAWDEKRLGLGPLYAVWDDNPYPAVGTPLCTSYYDRWSLELLIDPDHDPIYGARRDDVYALRDLRNQQLRSYVAGL